MSRYQPFGISPDITNNIGGILPNTNVDLSNSNQFLCDASGNNFNYTFYGLFTPAYVLSITHPGFSDST
jgi:hypothetical protein